MNKYIGPSDLQAMALHGAEIILEGWDPGEERTASASPEREGGVPAVSDDLADFRVEDPGELRHEPAGGGLSYRRCAIL